MKPRIEVSVRVRMIDAETGRGVGEKSRRRFEMPGLLGLRARDHLAEDILELAKGEVQEALVKLRRAGLYVDEEVSL